MNPIKIFRAFDPHLAWEGYVYLTVNDYTSEMTADLARPGEEWPRLTL